MIIEAQRRADGRELPVEYGLGDAHRLQLGDEEFDAARADRIFQHLADPRAALSEVVRVTRPRGRIAISDPDWETLLVDCADPGILRRLKHFLCDSLPGSSIAHKLPGLMRELGLEDVNVTPVTLVLDSLDAANVLLDLSNVADQARDLGAVTEEEHSSWLNDLRKRDAANRFFTALTGFLTSARKPDHAADSTASRCA